MRRKVKSVDQVLSVFKRAIDDLATVVNTQQEEADNQAELIVEATFNRDAAHHERDRAIKVQAKLIELIDN